MGASHIPELTGSRSRRNDYGYVQVDKQRSSSPPYGDPPPSNSLKTWAHAVWPLIAHCLLVITITGFVIFYVNGRHFNIENRNPSVTLADGTSTPWGIAAPLQSDITTLLSGALAILRLITACWLGPLCWRSAFILLEKTGLKPKQLHTMISYSVPVLPKKGETVISLCIWVVLAIVLPAHLVAPVLTGSITWVPSNWRAERPSASPIDVFAVMGGDNGWWTRYGPQWERRALEAAGLATISWGPNSQHRTLKRVLAPASGLEVNSTIANITLPYFSVTGIEWVQDPGNTLTQDQLSVHGVVCPSIQPYKQSECPLIKFGALALIPDTSQSNTSSTSPSLVSETRLMVLYTYLRGDAPGSSPTCGPESAWRLSGSLPPTIGIWAGDTGGGECWAFARVTYTAGAAVCTNCRLSSYATLQNDTDLEPQGDYITNDALKIMPTVISMMTLMNTSIPYPELSIDDYVIETLSRSYAASWTAITNFVGWGYDRVPTTYHTALPCSRGSVDLRRVYIWLCVQFLITLSGILFLWIQTSTNIPLVGDTTLLAFYLDSSGLYEKDAYNRLKEGELRVDRDGHMKVKVA